MRLSHVIPRAEALGYYQISLRETPSAS